MRRTVRSMAKSVMWATLLLAAGAVIASNMGFRILYEMKGPGPESTFGINMLGLPYLPREGLNNASELIDDINGKAGASVVVSVSVWEPNMDAFSGYTGTSGEAFPLRPGEGYLVQVDADVDYRIVGSHDPTYTIDLLGPEDPGSLTGRNLITLPYHATATSAMDLIEQINDQAGEAVVSSVAKWKTDQNAFVVYTGTSGEAFALQPGAAYLIQVSRTTTYRPEHY